MLFPPPQRCTEPLKWSELLEKHCQSSGLLHGADILNLVPLLALQLCSTIYEMPNSCHWRETQSCSCRLSIIRKKSFVIISLLSGCKLDRPIQNWPCLLFSYFCFLCHSTLFSTCPSTSREIEAPHKSRSYGCASRCREFGVTYQWVF